VPSDPLSVAVALADKIDTLTGFWAIDEKPTGSKDPFALRRAALGVIRLVLGNGVRASILGISRFALFAHNMQKSAGVSHARAVEAQNIQARLRDFSQGIEMEIREAALRMQLDGDDFWAGFKEISEDTNGRRADLLAFFQDRLKVYLRDQGIRQDVIDACLAMPGNDDLTLLVKRAEALAAFLKTDDGPNLLQGYKRASTILTQAEAKDGVEYSYGADVRYADCDEERALFAALDVAEAKIAPAMAAEDFAAAMAAMAQLRAPIDAFFTAVQVNADSAMIRRNRLNLLHRIRSLCCQVADLTKLEG
jgi:glycyl-tRNA synthetase beta chain